MKVIYNAISLTLLYYRKEPEKLRVLLLGLIGASAAKIGGGTIHSSFTIKPRKKLFGLSGKSKVVFLILDELSMVSSDLWTDVDSTLGEKFMLITEKQFAGL